MLTADAIAAFLEDRRARNCRARTLQFYQGELRRLPRDLPDGPGPIRSLLAEMTGSAASKHSRFRAFRAFFRWLVAEKLLAANPMELVAAPRVPKSHQWTLDVPDVDRLIDDGPATGPCARGMAYRDRAILTLILDTGLRSGEVRALRAKDLRERKIVVSGKSGEHVVHPRPETMAQLRFLAGAAIAGRPARPDDLVFRTMDGRPLSRDRLYRIVRTAIERAGIQPGGKRGPHCLRHTYGRHWMETGGQLTELQHALGHAQIATTAIYVDLAEDEHRRAHDRYSLLTERGAGKVRAVK